MRSRVHADFPRNCPLISFSRSGTRYVGKLNTEANIPTITILDCKAILFDMDGTLIDSTAVIHRTWRGWAQRHSLPLEPILKVEKGRPNREVLRQFAPHLDIEEESRLFLAAEIEDIAGLTIVHGAREAVRAAQKGHWAIVTSAERSLAEVRLKAVGLPLPEVLISADIVRRGKPDPECYLLASKRLGVSPEECVVFEDAPAGVLSGWKAGTPVIAVGSFTGANSGTVARIRDFTDLSIDCNELGTFKIRASTFQRGADDEVPKTSS
jgi:HAD superfamily hydrolase (TIGR01509 family)